MADSEGFEIDPAIAAAMGFSGFGMQPGKKRKFDAGGEAFVDSNIQQTATDSSKDQSSGRGANTTPLGSRSSGTQKSAAEAEAAGVPGGRAGGDQTPTLEDFRHGVSNERGDMVYFLPSFIEDPWKGLEPK